MRAKSEQMPKAFIILLPMKWSHSDVKRSYGFHKFQSYFLSVTRFFVTRIWHLQDYPFTNSDTWNHPCNWY